MCRAAAWHTSHVPRTFTRCTRSKSSSDTSTITFPIAPGPRACVRYDDVDLPELRHRLLEHRPHLRRVRYVRDDRLRPPPHLLDLLDHRRHPAPRPVRVRNSREVIHDHIRPLPRQPSRNPPTHPILPTSPSNQSHLTLKSVHLIPLTSSTNPPSEHPKRPNSYGPLATPFALSLSKGPPQASTNAGPTHHRFPRTHPDTPTPRRRGLSRMARPAQPVEGSPLHHQQRLPTHPTPTVVPAFAGTQGGALEVAFRQPALFATPNTSFPRPPSRHSCEDRNPEGRRAGQPHTVQLTHQPSTPRRSRFRGNPGQVRGRGASPSRRTCSPEPLIVIPAKAGIQRGDVCAHSPKPDRRRHEPRCVGGAMQSPFALSLSKGSSRTRRSHAETSNPTPARAMHPDTALLPHRSEERYRLPMVVANLPPQPQHHGSPHRRVRRPKRWSHGPQRWPESARQATGGVGARLQKKDWICS